MCLAIPGKVIEIESNSGNKRYILDYGVEKREAIASAVKVKIGDYVIVNNKIIIKKIAKKDFNNFMELIK
jgi:hydrogenase maturation factor